MSLKCYYHPARDTATKCEKCEKMICKECREPIALTHVVGDRSYATQHEYCLPCYYDFEMEKYGNPTRDYYISFFFLLIGGIVTFLSLYLSRGFFWNLLFGSERPPMLIIFAIVLLIMLLGGIGAFVRHKRKFPEAFTELKTRKEIFLQSGNVWPESGNIWPESGNKVETVSEKTIYTVSQKVKRGLAICGVFLLLISIPWVIGLPFVLSSPTRIFGNYTEAVLVIFIVLLTISIILIITSIVMHTREIAMSK